MAGLAAALFAAVAHREEEAARLRTLRNQLEAGLCTALPGAFVNSASAPRLPSTLSITFPGTDSEALLMALDLEGLCASAGSACHSGSSRPSTVLSALGLTKAEARATLRLSLGWTKHQRRRGTSARPHCFPHLARQVRAAIPAA